MDVGSYSEGEGTRSVLRESWTQPDCEPQHSQNAIDMRHKLRYERGGASHASCRHRNLVKLKCVSLNVSGLQDVGKFVRFCQVAKKWAADGKAQILCLQEHNLHPDKEDEHIRIALLNQADSLQ